MSDDTRTPLWEVKHPYYCAEGNYYAPGNEQPYAAYGSWAEFFEEDGDCDPDMNLLFRWDWREADPDEERHSDVLMLFWMGQRKGLYRWTEVKVTKDDELEIREWLAGRWAHLRKLWEPIA